jgi:hypothetical protein
MPINIVKETSMPVSSAAFYETYSLYRNALKFDKSKPYTYETWSRLDPSYKCAALYCNFFEQITLAWYKVATTWNSDVDGVEEVHKYLLKNVKKIEEDRRRFRPQYIYRVAWNCFDCMIPKWVPRLQWHIDHEANNEITDGEGNTSSVFDLMSDGKFFDLQEESDSNMRQDVTDELDEGTCLYIDYVTGSISEFELLKSLKANGLIEMPIRGKVARESAMSTVKSMYDWKVKRFILEHMKDTYEEFTSCIADKDADFLKKSDAELADDVLSGKYGSSEKEIREALDFRYSDVMNVVSKKMELLSKQ